MSLYKSCQRRLFDVGGGLFTFNSSEVVAMVRKLKKLQVTSKEEPTVSCRLPSFHHATQDPVENDIVISSTTKIVILEGNYTLLSLPPWDEIAALAHDRYSNQSDTFCKALMAD